MANQYQLSLSSRIKNAWNVFNDKDDYGMSSFSSSTVDYGPSSGSRLDRARMTRGNERSIINAIYTRIANDVSMMTIEHVKLDENKCFKEVVDSGLNNCLTVEANIDQTGRAFILDAVLSMFDEGCVALVPIDTKGNPRFTDSYDILTMRVAKITQWYPNHVKIRVYNERTGHKEDKIVPKHLVSIVENPMYSIMNEPNSTVQRLIRKLNILDAIDEQSGSGKMDMIIQLPYTVKSEARKQQIVNRRKDIQEQLADSKYGIAYLDATEKVTQLNRPVDNNLMTQIEFLTNQVYSQLGITTSVLDGTADEKTMLNYYNRTVEPVLSALTTEMIRKFLSKTARSQRQSIIFFRDPFKLVPTSELADIADKFTRNEILSSNEVRQIIGMKPIDDPRANELRNKNINAANGQEFATTDGQPYEEGGGEIQNEEEFV